MLKEHPKEPGSHEETLWAVCDHLWSTKVRTTLIYGSSLELCRTCISFFDSKEKHDHPERDIVTVQQYFLANELTSLDKMVDFFKPPIRSTSNGQLATAEPLLPALSTKHRVLHVTGGSISSNPFLPLAPFLCKDNSMLLMQEIERLHKTVYSLQWELDQLR